MREGISIGRRRVRRLMRRLGLWAVRPKRNTSKRHPEHKVYPYLLRGKTIDQPNQVWAADVTYIPMQQGFLYLVAIIDWATRRVLSWRLSNTLAAGFCVEALNEALARFGKPGIFNTDQARNSPAPSLPRSAGLRGRDQHGWARALPRQHLCRAPVVDREARMGLSAPSRQRHRTEAKSCRVLRLVQPRSITPITPTGWVGFTQSCACPDVDVGSATAHLRISSPPFDSLSLSPMMN